MGIFLDRRPQTEVAKTVVRNALALKPEEVQDFDAEASKRAEALLGGKDFKTGRFVIAVVILIIVGGAGVLTEATGLAKSTDALWALAPAIFGVIVGLLGGEATAD